MVDIIRTIKIENRAGDTQISWDVYLALLQTSSQASFLTSFFMCEIGIIIPLHNTSIKIKH